MIKLQTVVILSGFVQLCLFRFSDVSMWLIYVAETMGIARTSYSVDLQPVQHIDCTKYSDSHLPRVGDVTRVWLLRPLGDL